MDTGKHISTLFYENAGKVTVQPSAQSWQKLEQRLNDDHRQGRVVLLRRIMAAAAVLVVLVAVWFSYNSFHQETFARLAAAPPMLLEELENSNGCEPYCLVMKARNELPAYYATPVLKMK